MTASGTVHPRSDASAGDIGSARVPANASSAACFPALACTPIARHARRSDIPLHLRDVAIGWRFQKFVTLRPSRLRLAMILRPDLDRLRLRKPLTRLFFSLLLRMLTFTAKPPFSGSNASVRKPRRILDAGADKSSDGRGDEGNRGRDVSGGRKS